MVMMSGRRAPQVLKKPRFSILVARGVACSWERCHGRYGYGLQRFCSQALEPNCTARPPVASRRPCALKRGGKDGDGD